MARTVFKHSTLTREEILATWPDKILFNANRAYVPQAQFRMLKRTNVDAALEYVNEAVVRKLVEEAFNKGVEYQKQLQEL